MLGSLTGPCLFLSWSNNVCCTWQCERGKSGGLTLDEPGSPDRVVQTDLIPPEQPQTLEGLPLGRDNLTAAREKQALSHCCKVEKYIIYEAGQISGKLLFFLFKETIHS